MKKGLAGIALFSLVLGMIIPAHAAVTSLELEKSFYTNVENFKFIGTQDGKETTFVIIRGPLPGDDFRGMLSDPSPDQGEFEVIPKQVTNFFSSKGTYNATAFVDSQKENEGMTIEVEYDGNKVFQVPDFVLALKSIQDVTINEEKTVSFTVGITDSSIDGVVYSLEKSPPTGATIDSETGKFTWTPSSSHGNSPGAKYTFDIVATKESQVDRESITITVNDPISVPPVPKKPEPEAKEPEEIAIPAPFVDESKDPQSYVDRYNNEASYREWFDESYPQYDSIYEAVGLEPAKELEFGECGEGTDLVDETCVIVDNSRGGGCLIATAAYGTELAPQVQFLREVRDNTVMGTSSGAVFMSGFNQLYYSFSPTIADWQRENPMLQQAVRAFITPMVSTLSIMTLADSGSESDVLGLGISVIALNLGMYIAAPALIAFRAREFFKN